MAITRYVLALAAMVIFALGAYPAEAANPCNPCAKKMSNPCNPCGKNACNPCAKNPCNPCNPCGAAKKPIRSTHSKDYGKLVAMGKKMWNDEKLGTSDMACMTCHDEHEDLNIDRHQGTWPHDVPGMTNDIVTLSQMINFCMLNPMEGKMLDGNSIEMTAMVAYYYDYIKLFNPCAVKEMRSNPCNPCAKRNPCARRNPCMKRNPCNPCGR